jgi:hypothetical protein
MKLEEQQKGSVVERWKELKKLLIEPNLHDEYTVTPQMWEAFHKASMEHVEQVKGYKVRFSKKNRR